MIYRLVIALCCLLPFSNSLLSQNYFVGQPVHDTIMSFNYATIDFCFPDPDIELQLAPELFPPPQGTQVLIVVDEIIPSGGVIGSSAGIYLNPGDSLFFSDTVLSYPLFFFSASEIKFSYLVVGTPELLGEAYYCGVDSSFTFGTCNNWFRVYPESFSPNCVVSTFNSLQVIEPSKSSFFPNPASNEVFFRGTELTSAQIYDLNGQALWEGKIENNAIDVRNISTGTYLVHWLEKGNQYRQILLIE